MSAPTPGPWGEFTADPRRPELAGLRAADRDRDVVLRLLGDAYADGRLTREEYDERAGRVAEAKTLGDLRPLMTDLVVATPLPDPAAGDLHRKAVEHWQSQRRQALVGLLIPSTICWLIWVMVGLDGGFGFAWPVFVMLGTGANLVRVQVTRTDLVAEEERRLERRQRKALGSAPERPAEE